MSSKTTTAIAFRLPNAVVAILERRAKRKGMILSDYLRWRTIYEVERKH